MTRITLDTVVAQVGRVFHTDCGPEILGMDVEAGIYFSLEGSGREIWKAAQTPVRVSDVCTRLRAIYSVDEATCAAQVMSFIDDLVNRKLLVILDPERDHA